MSIKFRKGKLPVITEEYRVATQVERPPKAVIEGFRKLPVDHIAALCSDAMGRTGGMAPRIKPIVEGVKLAGPAFTVKPFPRDHLLVHKATMIAEPGDVIVVDTQGTYDCVVMGGSIATFSKARKIAGAVIDGAVRDTSDMKRLRFPVFAAAVAVLASKEESGGLINVPIHCGGQIVKPGDIIVGDDDGVTVVPRMKAETVLERAQELAKVEKELEEAFEKGEIQVPIDVDEILRRKGIERTTS